MNLSAESLLCPTSSSRWKYGERLCDNFAELRASLWRWSRCSTASDWIWVSGDTFPTYSPPRWPKSAPVRSGRWRFRLPARDSLRTILVTWTPWPFDLLPTVKYTLKQWLAGIPKSDYCPGPFQNLRRTARTVTHAIQFAAAGNCSEPGESLDRYCSDIVVMAK